MAKKLLIGYKVSKDAHGNVFILTDDNVLLNARYIVSIDTKEVYLSEYESMFHVEATMHDKSVFMIDSLESPKDAVTVIKKLQKEITR